MVSIDPFFSFCLCKLVFLLGIALGRFKNFPFSLNLHSHIWYCFLRRRQQCSSADWEAGRSLHDILGGLLFLFWDYLISQEIILFQLSSPPINSEFLGERVVVEEWVCVCVCVCVCNVSQSSWVLGPPQLPPSESGILKAWIFGPYSVLLTMVNLFLDLAVAVNETVT